MGRFVERTLRNPRYVGAIAYGMCWRAFRWGRLISSCARNHCARNHCDRDTNIGLSLLDSPETLFAGEQTTPSWVRILEH
jgi:hypothetical protein